MQVCNLCGSREHVQVTGRDRYGFPAAMHMCTRCGLGFLSPRLTPSEYADFYRSVYRPLISAHHGRRIDAQTLQEGQLRYAGKLVRFLRPVLPAPPASVLDVGGSTGVVAAAVCDAFGARATVLDPSPDELARAALKGLETIEGFVEAFDPGDRRWDLVLLCQTIDHLLDIATTLSALRRMTAEHGLAFVDVIDLMRVARKAGAVEAAVKVDHPYYLTYETAQAFFALAGFEPVAERPGHLAFALAPGVPREPDWEQLRRVAQANIEELQALSATAETSGRAAL